MNYYNIYIKSITETDTTGFKHIRHDLNGMKYHSIETTKENFNHKSYSTVQFQNTLDIYGSIWLSNEILIVDIDNDRYNKADVLLLEQKIRVIIRKELHRNKLIDDILK